MSEPKSSELSDAGPMDIVKDFNNILNEAADAFLVNKVLHQNCITYMRKSPSKAELIILDPPYNYGQQYAGYDDTPLSEAAFEARLREWLSAAVYHCANNGSIWIFIPDEWVSFVDLYMRKSEFMTRRSWIIWHYTFGVNQPNNFTRSKTHILYFTKSPTNFIFNKEAIAVPSRRQLMGDKRANNTGRNPDNTWILFQEQYPADGTQDLDYWLQSRICGTFSERQPHSPNQLPIAIADRIVRVASAKYSYVYDAFAGTGTFGEVCVLTKRNCISTDVSETCVRKSQERINKARLIHLKEQ
jgi:DNA modification methylase